jgi:hypothetical protein
MAAIGLLVACTNSGSTHSSGKDTTTDGGTGGDAGSGSAAGTLSCTASYEVETPFNQVGMGAIQADFSDVFAGGATVGDATYRFSVSSSSLDGSTIALSLSNVAQNPSQTLSRVTVAATQWPIAAGFSLLNQIPPDTVLVGGQVETFDHLRFDCSRTP